MGEYDYAPVSFGLDEAIQYRSHWTMTVKDQISILPLNNIT